MEMTPPLVAKGLGSRMLLHICLPIGSIVLSDATASKIIPSPPRHLFKCLNVGLSRGNPQVNVAYPYPYPPKPLPLMEGKGFLYTRVRVKDRYGADDT